MFRPPGKLIYTGLSQLRDGAYETLTQMHEGFVVLLATAGPIEVRSLSHHAEKFPAEIHRGGVGELVCAGRADEIGQVDPLHKIGGNLNGRGAERFADDREAELVFCEKSWRNDFTFEPDHRFRAPRVAHAIGDHHRIVTCRGWLRVSHHERCIRCLENILAIKSPLVAQWRVTVRADAESDAISAKNCLIA